MSEKFSPQWFTDEILARRAGFERAVTNRITLAQGHRLFYVILFLLSAAGLYRWLSPNLCGLTLGFGAMLAACLFIFDGRRLDRPAIHFLVWLCCAALMSWAQADAGFAWIYFLIILSTQFLMWFVFLRVKNLSSLGKILSSAITCMLLFLVYSYFREGWFGLKTIIMMKPQRFILLLLPPLFSMNSDMGAESKWLSFKMFFFPFNMISPLPTTLGQWKNPELVWPSQVRGFFDVVLGTLFIVLTFYTNLLQPPPTGAMTFAQFVGFGCISYVEFYLVACGTLTTAVGFARLLGFDMYDAFTLPLLAASPYDRWRKWNTYYFNFLRWFVYLPLIRRLRSIFIPVMITFVVTLFLHEFSLNPLNIFNLHLDRTEANPKAFYLAHGLAVYISLRWKLKIYDGSQRTGWFGVLVTWLMMIVIHNLSRLIS
ncbi:MAG: hypothetical protein ACXWQE_14805 [Bdellovibrionales bacterium]